MFDKGFVNREKWGPTPNKRVSEQEVDSLSSLKRLLKNYKYRSTELHEVRQRQWPS